MRWESVLWMAVALFSPLLAVAAWPRIRAGRPAWSPYVESFAPWAHGIGPAYLALITGAIRARDFGLASREAPVWIAGLILSAAWLVLNHRLRPQHGRWPMPVRGALDEPRWALYRAGAALWLNDPAIALLGGLGLALAEWGMVSLPGIRKEHHRWETLARIGSSSVIFALTNSFWLTLATQAMLLELAHRRRR
jgi:hypothetical protein